MSGSPDYVVLCVLAHLAKMSWRQVSAASLGGKCLRCVNAIAPASTWMVRYAISSIPVCFYSVPQGIFGRLTIDMFDPASIPHGKYWHCIQTSWVSCYSCDYCCPLYNWAKDGVTCFPLRDGVEFSSVFLCLKRDSDSVRSVEVLWGIGYSFVVLVKCNIS